RLTEPWLGLAVIASVALLVQLIHLPLSVWRTFGLEARFGFNRTTPALFLADLDRGLALAVALGAPVLTAILLLMERAVRWWWVWAWGLWLAVMLLMTWAWPAFIAPLFNRFVPLPDLALRARIEALLDRCGFSSRGVFVVDSSRRSTHGNAYFTGIGRHKRIVFFDTLLEQLAHPEVEAVLAHRPRRRPPEPRRGPGAGASSGNVVKIDRLADALERPVRIEPGVVGGIASARELGDRHPAAHRPARPENHERRQRLALQVRRATVGDAELRDAELRGAQLQPSQILPPVQIRIDQHP